MCLCKGTGGINIKQSWGIKYHPCPDTNCTFDREKSKRELLEWERMLLDKFGKRAVV